MNDDIFCKDCKYSMVYDEESTFYLKCPSCGKVLVDRRVEDVWKEPLTIASCGKAGYSFWVKVRDNDGKVHLCWKS